jgi:hypothetical protein
MPQTIEWGGSNGVGVVDFGLPGGSLNGSGSARSAMTLVVGPAPAPVSETSQPQMPFVSSQQQPARAKQIVAEGRLVCVNYTTLQGIIDEIDKRRTVDSFMRPTMLRKFVNGGLVRTFTSVRLDDFVETRADLKTADGWVMTEIRVVWKVVRT